MIIKYTLTLLGTTLKNTRIELIITNNGKIPVRYYLANHFNLIRLNLKMSNLNGYEGFKLIKKDNYDFTP